MTFTNSQNSSFQNLMSYHLSSVAAEPPYKLTLSLHDLLTPKLKSNGTPARLQNAYSLFLKDYTAKVKQQGPNQGQKLTRKEIRYHANKAWNSQPSQVTRFFEILSMNAKEIHESLYPDHKYRPTRKYGKKIKRTNDENKKELRPNHTINNTINLPTSDVLHASVDYSFPNLDVDFELYEPKEEEIYFSLFPTSLDNL
ncbi:10286_t:CDS:1 [Funneliformis geosporum]|uniref:16160_t:CDS:1 n=1 Tax=Funneliformis geosporum TaxID=1117311 RepID=A0A9W4SIA6_9GLOM|nr:10286_t:CDS:1 [Funneliformis geosporum]CAI2170450.1 16160_t:CDS:1 [Funneliformis geosporum]